MRILFVSKYAVSPDLGDPTRQFFYCKYLSRQPDTSVLMVSSRSSTCNLLLPFKGVSIERHYGRLCNLVLNGPAITLGLNWKRVWSWFWFEIQVLRIFGLLKRWKPDVVIVSSLSVFTFVTGIILKFLLRKPLIVEVRDVYPETLQSLGNFSSFHPAVLILRRVEKLAYRYADAIVSSLPNLTPHVRAVLGAEKPVTYLPMGVDPEFYFEPPISDKARKTIEKIDSLEDAFLVGYVGTIGLANALDEPLQVFRSLAKDYLNLHLILVGDGPLLERYQAEFGNETNIHFMGRHSKSDLPAIMSRMSLLISPWLDRSVYRHGISPNKWIDYLSAGKPILASFGGYRFLLEEQQCGWFIPPQQAEELRSAIVRIAAMPVEQLAEMGSRGKKYLNDHLQYSSLADQLRSVIDSVTNVSEAQTDKGLRSKRNVI